MMNWCTIESDPGVFSELIAAVGVKGVKVEEVYDLQTLGEDPNHRVYGLIFLFKWRHERDAREVSHVPGLFFAKQVITNACATQAILSILLNSPEIDLGEVMGSFKSFTADFPPDLKGEAIGSCVPLREAHNSFARAEPFDIEAKEAKEDDDVFHFIGYVPFNGAVYELDGLKGGPIKLADIQPGQSWLVPVRELIMKRINLYVASEIRFNLMEVTPDLRALWKARIAELEQQLAKGDDGGAQPMDTGEEGANPAAAELESLKLNLATEDEKFTMWKEENIRRRHNYVPFIMQMLKLLGEKGHLVPLLEEAEEKSAQSKRAKQGK